MAKIRKIEPVMPTLPTRKKVAAYARVSMETERLHHSLSAQVSYYSDLIQRNPEWEYHPDQVHIKVCQKHGRPSGDRPAPEGAGR